MENRQEADIIRDPNSGALINKDLDAFKRFKKARQDQKTIQALYDRLEKLEQQVKKLTNG